MQQSLAMNLEGLYGISKAFSPSSMILNLT
jgi:hypothetical protein